MIKQPFAKEEKKRQIHGIREPYLNGISPVSDDEKILQEDSDRCSSPEQPLSLLSLTLVLAYIYRHNPPLLPRRRFLAPSHLRQLAAWIDKPAPKLRTIRAHRPLMAHFTLLQAAGLVQVHNTGLYLTPKVTDWLHFSPADQLRSLLEAMMDDAWQTTLKEQGWQQSLGLDYEAYIQQQLQHRLSSITSRAPNAVCRATWGKDRFIIELNPDSPIRLQFDLLQLGDWQPEHTILCTPLSIGQAAARGYGLRLICRVIETATGTALTLEQEELLNIWLRQSRAYHLESTLLLATAQDHQLNAILKQARFKPYIKEQISPRHATVSADFPDILQNWLRQQGYPLHIPAANVENNLQSEAAGPDYQWLGLRLLIGLGELLPLPYPPPFAQLEQLTARLSDRQHGDLEAKAKRLLQQLRDAIRGRDAFLPATQPVDSKLIKTVRQAIAHQVSLEIHYQSPADYEPRYRRIQPLRLERRGALLYLHAYCYRAEANLVFRLDRMTVVSDDNHHA